VSSRGLSHLVPAKLLDPAAHPRAAVKAVLKAWLPLSEAVLGMAVTHLPSPDVAAPLRLPYLLSGGSNTALLPLAAAGAAYAAAENDRPIATADPEAAASASSTGNGDGSSVQARQAAASQAAEVQQQLERAYSHLCASSSSSEAPLVVFVSKMVAVPANLLPRRVGEAGEQVGVVVDAACL
jgi:ribosome assembly protein 1